MKEITVILYGQPGSGKGTQAELIAREFGLIHFDTGRFCESVVHDPKRQRDKVIRRERKLFDGGILMTPSFVLREVMKRVRQIARAGSGVVFSGSPRTLYEAKGLLPVLEKLYGKRNIYTFALEVSLATSLKRNSKRLICSVCKAPLLTKYYPSRKPTHCPICGGPLYKRSLDNPRVIKVRLKEYKERTEPIFHFLKERGYPVHKINGAPAPYLVFRKIAKFIK